MAEQNRRNGYPCHGLLLPITTDTSTKVRRTTVPITTDSLQEIQQQSNIGESGNISDSLQEIQQQSNISLQKIQQQSNMEESGNILLSVLTDSLQKIQQQSNMEESGNIPLLVLTKIQQQSNMGKSGNILLYSLQRGFGNTLSLQEIQQKKCLILALKGGGVKGVSELVVLAAIELATGKPISKLFDYIAGTSVGALIATLLTLPKEKGSQEPCYSAQDALEIFKEVAGKIFPEHSLKQWTSVGGYAASRYSQAPLKKLLIKYCKDYTLKDTIIPITIPLYKLHAPDPVKVCSTQKAYNGEDFFLRDLLLAATAAPSFFNPVELKNCDGKLSCTAADGGVHSNNPSGVILHQLEKNIKPYLFYLSLEDQHTEHGSGGLWHSLNLDTGKIGVAIGPFFDNLMGAADQKTEAGVQKNLRTNYTKFSIPIPKEHAALDNARPKNLKALEDIGNKSTETLDFNNFMYKLNEARSDQLDQSELLGQ